MTVICKTHSSPAVNVMFLLSKASAVECDLWKERKNKFSVGFMQMFWLKSEEMSFFYFSPQSAVKRLTLPDFKSRTSSHGDLQLYCHITHFWDLLTE